MDTSLCTQKHTFPLEHFKYIAINRTEFFECSSFRQAILPHKTMLSCQAKAAAIDSLFSTYCEFNNILLAI